MRVIINNNNYINDINNDDNNDYQNNYNNNYNNNNDQNNYNNKAILDKLYLLSEGYKLKVAKWFIKWHFLR